MKSGWVLQGDSTKGSRSHQTIIGTQAFCKEIAFFKRGVRSGLFDFLQGSSFSRSQWAALGLGRTSIGSSQSEWAAPGFNAWLASRVVSAGPQPRSSRSEWAAPGFNRQKKCRKSVRKTVKKMSD